MSSTVPFSIRLSKALDAAITEEARRTKRSKGAVLESLAVEAMRARGFPGIAFRGDDWNRRAWVIGTGFDVWELTQAIQELGGADQVVKESGLTPAQVAVAEAYYRVYGDEVDALIDDNRQTLADLARAYPTFEVQPPATGRRH
jgi:hypothetical protein